MRKAPHVCSVMGTKAGVLVFAHAFPRLVRSGRDTMVFNGSDVYVSVDHP